MATRVITGTILHADSTPWVGATVTFEMTEGTFTVGPDVTFLRDGVTAVTDTAGAFTVTLTSGLDVYWRCSLPDGNGFRFALPVGSATTIEVLRSATEGLPIPITTGADILITGATEGQILVHDGTQFVNTSTIGSGDIVYDLNGVSLPDYHRLDIRDGTHAAPVGIGTTVAVHRIQSVTRAAVDAVSSGTDGWYLLGAINGLAEGTSTDETQPVGVAGYAVQGSTQVAAGNDACGIYGAGSVTAGSKGQATGGFFLGVNNSADAAAWPEGVEVHCVNLAGANLAYDPAGFNSGTGIWLTSRGTKNNAVGLSLGWDNTGTSRWDVGIAIPAMAGGGNTGSVITASLRDDGNAVTVFDINGSHTNGLDTSGATFSGKAILLGATHTVAWGTTSSFPMLKRSSAEMHIRLADDSLYASVRGREFIMDHTAGQATSLTWADGGADKWYLAKGTDNSLYFWSAAAAGKAIDMGAGATLKLGFYNTAAIAKPTGVAVTDAGIHAALVSLGLIAA